MKSEFVGSSICTAVSATTTVIQPDAVLQYISIAITIVAGLISIILGLRAWWKDAKKDGKIDKEEVAEMGFGSYGLDNQSTVPVFWPKF